jgi:hypothetical protein
MSRVKGQCTRQESEPIPVKHPPDIHTNGTCSGASTPSTISPGENRSLEDELSKVGIQFSFVGIRPHFPVHVLFAVCQFLVFR